MRVWCLRHGESENVVGGVAGAVATVPLTERGRYQASEAARVLADQAISRLYSSTAVRARQTAEVIGGSLGIDVVTMAGLAEVHIGGHEGTTDPAVRARTAEVLRAWVVDQALDRRVGDGETGHEVVARVMAAFATIAGAHRGEAVALVGHVASLTVTLGRLCGLGALVWGTPLPHARPFLVEWDGRSWHCPDWPDATAARL